MTRWLPALLFAFALGCGGSDCEPEVPTVTDDTCVQYEEPAWPGAMTVCCFVVSPHGGWDHECNTQPPGE